MLDNVSHTFPCYPWNLLFWALSKFMSRGGVRELPDMMSTISFYFWTPPPSSAFRTVFYYKIHPTFLTTSAFPWLLPSPSDADIISGESLGGKSNNVAGYSPEQKPSNRVKISHHFLLMEELTLRSEKFFSLQHWAPFDSQEGLDAKSTTTFSLFKSVPPVNPL